MAITGISAISGEQIIAAGAVSAKEAGKASFTTGGNDIQNLYDTVSTKSASWTGGGGELPQSATEAIEAVTANSAYWDGAYTAVDSNSGAWSETYGAVNSMSAEWTSAFTSVNQGSGAWDSAWAAIYSPDASANLWNSASTAVVAGSGVWDGTYVTVNQNSGNWEEARGVVTAGSSYWDGTYATVHDNSASWTASGPSYTGDAQGALDEVYSKSADWNSAAAMNELPVSAGEGIDIQNVDGNIVFSCTGGSVPEGVLVESGLEYNAANEISGYSGSAFAQPSISAAEWNSNYETVNTNSGAWGGNALPISAGPGVKVELTDGKLLFSTDETVLWSGTNYIGSAGYVSVSLSEAVTNFNTVKITFARGANFPGDEIFEFVPDNSKIYLASLNCYDNNFSNMYCYFNSFTLSGSNYTELSGKCGFYQVIAGTGTAANVNKTNCWLHPYKIVGINRTAGGN